MIGLVVVVAVRKIKLILRRNVLSAHTMGEALPLLRKASASVVFSYYDRLSEIINLKERKKKGDFLSVVLEIPLQNWEVHCFLDLGGDADCGRRQESERRRD